MTAKRHLLKNLVPIGFAGHDGAGRVDIAVAGDAVEAAGAGLAADGREAVDCKGAYVSPAWVDMHTHIYWGGSDIAVWPHEIGLATGVPILVDAGSAGEGHFHGLREFIMKPAKERIIPFLNVGSVGLVATNRVPEVRRLSDIDSERVMKTVADNAGLIGGLKVRLCSIIESETDLLPLKLAKKLARVLRLPLMVHIGRVLPLPEEVVDRLDAGDILTHCCHGKAASSVVDEPVAFDAARRARERGVAMDIGHGSASFSYRVARECLDRGFLPDTLGSDLHNQNLDGPVWDLSVVMSKLLALGLPLAKVVDGVTAAPRRALRLPEARLEPGAEAAFTLFTREAADLVLPDSLGDTLRLGERIQPRAVFWQGELREAASRLKTK